MGVYEVLVPPIGVNGLTVRDRYVELTEQQSSGLVENGTIKLLPEAVGAALLAEQNKGCELPKPVDAPLPPSAEILVEIERNEEEEDGVEEVEDESTGENPQKMNLNSASLADLTTLKYVGTATAKKIIAGRPYETIEEVIEASELSEERWLEIMDQVEV